MTIERQIYDVGHNFELSVVSASYAYCDQGSVEIAILENGNFRYDLSGGDVIGYFPITHLNDFVSFVKEEIQKNPNLSDMDLVRHFGLI
jgi:hypothetical protein